MLRWFAAGIQFNLAGWGMCVGQLFFVIFYFLLFFNVIVFLSEQWKMYNSAKYIFDCSIKTTEQVACSYVKLHLGTAVLEV